MTNLLRCIYIILKPTFSELNTSGYSISRVSWHSMGASLLIHFRYSCERLRMPRWTQSSPSLFYYLISNKCVDVTELFLVFIHWLFHQSEKFDGQLCRRLKPLNIYIHHRWQCYILYRCYISYTHAIFHFKILYRYIEDTLPVFYVG